jgi:hypothetical protein
MMAREIERKFLPANDAWRALALGTRYRQGYLNNAKECTVRVRTIGEHQLSHQPVFNPERRQVRHDPVAAHHRAVGTVDALSDAVDGFQEPALVTAGQS